MDCFVIRLAGLAMAALIADGCATTPRQAVPAVVGLRGTLVAVRPVTPAISRQSVLSALGAAAPEGGAAVVECIVAADDGRTLSVVQPDPGGLRPGLRVALLTGNQPPAETRVAAAAP